MPITKCYNKNVLVIGKKPCAVGIITILQKTTKNINISKTDKLESIYTVLTSLNALLKGYFIHRVFFVTVGSSLRQRDDTAAEC